MAVSVGRLVGGTSSGEGVSINGVGVLSGVQLPSIKTGISKTIKNVLMPPIHLGPGKPLFCKAMLELVIGLSIIFSLPPM